MRWGDGGHEEIEAKEPSYPVGRGDGERRDGGLPWRSFQHSSAAGRVLWGALSHQNKVRVPITRYNFFWPSLLAREQGGDRGKWRLADPDLEGQRGKEGVLCPVAYFWVMRDHFLELQSGWRVLLCGRIWGGDSVSIVCLPQWGSRGCPWVVQVPFILEKNRFMPSPESPASPTAERCDLPTPIQLREHDLLGDTPCSITCVVPLGQQGGQA